jgi:hypothetical protein
MIFAISYFVIGWFVTTIILSILFKITNTEWDDEVDLSAYGVAFLFWPILLFAFLVVGSVYWLKRCSEMFYKIFFR